MRTLILILCLIASCAYAFDLEWDAAAGATGYNIYESTTSKGPWTKVNTAPITGVTYTYNPDTTNARKLFFCCTAINSTQESERSNICVALVGSPCVITNVGGKSQFNNISTGASQITFH